VKRQKIQAKHADAVDPAIPASPGDIDLDEPGVFQDPLTQPLECRRLHLEKTLQQPILPRNFECRIGSYCPICCPIIPARVLLGFVPLFAPVVVRRGLFDLPRNDRDFRGRNRKLRRSLPSHAFVRFGTQLIRAGWPDGVIFSQLPQRFSPLACFCVRQVGARCCPEQDKVSFRKHQQSSLIT